MPCVLPSSSYFEWVTCCVMFWSSQIITFLVTPSRQSFTCRLESNSSAQPVQSLQTTALILQKRSEQRESNSSCHGLRVIKSFKSFVRAWGTYSRRLQSLQRRSMLFSFDSMNCWQKSFKTGKGQTESCLGCYKQVQRLLLGQAQVQNLSNFFK